jgi:hypothetical protein
MAAAYAGNAQLVKDLLARGADPRAVDRIGKTAMVYGAGQGHAAVVRALLEHGVDVNATYRNRLTALMWAAGYGRDEAVAALLQAGARADLRDDRGKSAADIAREAGHPATARLLLEKP